MLFEKAAHICQLFHCQLLHQFLFAGRNLVPAFEAIPPCGGIVMCAADLAPTFNTADFRLFHEKLFIRYFCPDSPVFIIYDQRQILLTDDLHSSASRDNFVARVFHGEMSGGISRVHLFMYYFRHIRYKGRRDMVADD